MFSKKPKTHGMSAAWRIAIWPTAAFAVGSALAFVIMYLLIALDIQKRSDAWLSGEAETLNDVSGNTTRDALYDRLVGEVAELASREVPDTEEEDNRDHPTSVFFLETTPGEIDPIWVGPGPKEPFTAALKGAQLIPGQPASVQVEGWKKAFRVVYKKGGDGGELYLGFSDLSGAAMLNRLTVRCILAWAITVALGFFITWLAAFRTLARVDRISDTVARMGSDDLSSRLSEGPHPDEITRLSRTFNRMLDRIQASVHQMRVLTDSVAHDLKSPVTSIRGSLEVALSSNSQGQWRERVAEAIEGLDRLAQLLNTTLDVAEADAGALQLRKETIDLSEMVSRLVDLYQPAIAEHCHEVVTDLRPAVVEADTGLLHRTIANLLDNEITHLPPGCRIMVSVHPINSDAEFTVADNGPGFPEELRRRAFDRFVKGEHSTGHGLGLAFVGAAIQAHGGQAEVRERSGGGAMIVLRIPLAEVLSKKV
jgi:signal transduction histidine kinase